MSTTMYRKTTCTACNYSQTTVLSYYLDRKMWDKQHDLVACLSLRKMSEGSARLELLKKGN
jgi:hypothetical protein